MKYKTAADILAESRTRGEIANFFIDTGSYPEMVMSVLIEKRKAAPLSRPSPPPAVRSAWSALAGKVRAGRPSFFSNLVARNLFLVCVFMFLSCAVAPNQISAVHAGGQDLKLMPYAPVGPDVEIETVDGTMEAAWFAIRHRLNNAPLPEALAESFVGKLITGNWAGFVLIDRDGGVKATARDESFPVVSNWLGRYHELHQENGMLRDSLNQIQEARQGNRIYLEIDLDANLLFVKMNTEILYQFPIVSGKGYTSRESKRRRRFATPRGVLTVQTKERNPVWRPPAWHWTERGLDAPSGTIRVRGVLGKFRLNLGNGYGIHGTATGGIGHAGKYSHGCIRMNARDLETVFRLSDVGTRVYVY